MIDFLKIIKNKFFPFFCRLFVFLGTSFPAFALEVPSDYYYIKGTCSVGSVTIYVPYNYAKYFGLGKDGSYDIPINEYSSSISMYGYTSNGTEYKFTFKSFSDVSVRLTSGSSFSDETLVHITETNIPSLNSTDFTFFGQDTIVNMAVCLMLGVIVLLCIMRL